MRVSLSTPTFNHLCPGLRMRSPCQFAQDLVIKKFIWVELKNSLYLGLKLYQYKEVA